MQKSKTFQLEAMMKNKLNGPIGGNGILLSWFKQWFFIGGILIIIGASLFFFNNRNGTPIHDAISVDDVITIKSWGNNNPNEKEREENKESIEKITAWFNSAQDIRRNPEFSGSTPEAGMIIELKSGHRILINRSGSDFEVQRNDVRGNNISYWAKQPELKVVLDKLASKPPEPQPEKPIITEIIEGINDWEGYREIKYSNGWVKQLQGELEGDSVSVAAGALRNDPKQGVLHVTIHGRGKESPFFFINNYLTSEKHGALKIVAFKDFILSLEAENGSYWEFDVLTGIYRNLRADLRNLAAVPESIKEQVQAQLILDEGLETYFYKEGKTFVLLKSPKGNMDVRVTGLSQETGQKVTIEYIIGGSRKNKVTSVYYSLSELNGEFMVAFKSTDFTEQTISNKYLKEEQALEVAKSHLGSNSQTAKWSARLDEDVAIDNGNNTEDIYTVWIVEALYPAGNKESVYLDAVTGWLLVLAEEEAEF